MTSQDRDLSRLQISLKEVRGDLESERRLVAAGEAQIKMLKAELRRTEEEIRTIRQSQETEDRGSNADMVKLREQNEKISAENFEYAVENVSIKWSLELGGTIDNYCEHRANSQMSLERLFTGHSVKYWLILIMG